MPKILISDALSNLANEVFERNNIEVDTQTDLTTNELKDIINQYDGLVVRSATKATDEIISAGLKLKIIGRAGAAKDSKLNVEQEFLSREKSPHHNLELLTVLLCIDLQIEEALGANAPHRPGRQPFAGHTL